MCFTSSGSSLQYSATNFVIPIGIPKGASITMMLKRLLTCEIRPIPDTPSVNAKNLLRKIVTINEVNVKMEIFPVAFINDLIRPPKFIHFFQLKLSTI